jgi:signal transduction histidine kinase
MMSPLELPGQRPIGSEQPAIPPASRSRPTDREQRLWGVKLRLGVGVAFLLLGLVFTFDRPIIWATLLGYVCLAVAGAWLEVRDLYSDLRVNLFLLLDVSLVTLVTHATGTQTTPVSALHFPLVVAYTLRQGTRTGVLAACLCLGSFGALLVMEGAGWLPLAPWIVGDPVTNAMQAETLVGYAVAALALYVSYASVTYSMDKLGESAIQADRLAEQEQEAQLESQRMQAKMWNAQRLEGLGRMAGGIAHEFNNLLTVILGSSRMVLDQPELGAEDRMDVEEITQAARRGQNLVRQLLSYSRQQVANRERFDLRALVMRVKPMIEKLAPERILLRLQMANGPVEVVADVDMLEQLLINLVTNAFHASAPGSEVLVAVDATEVQSAAPEPGASVANLRRARLLVRDSGSGMEPGTLAAALDPFFTTKPLGQGTGLGLAVVRDVVEQHEGTLQIESSPGRGTQAVVWLPLSSSEQLEQIDLALMSQSPPETILVVEDEALVRKVAARLLERLGYRVLLTGNAAEALEYLKRENGQVDLLLSDLVLPGSSGCWLARQARALQPGLRLMFMSGNGADVFLLTQEEFAQAPVLQKPFTPQLLARRVREALDGDSASQES